MKKVSCSAVYSRVSNGSRDGSTEPCQIFIPFMILEKEGANERQDMAKILESFEFISTK
jgi:hypothetical protein